MGGTQSCVAEMHLLLIGTRACGTGSVMKAIGLRRRPSEDEDRDTEQDEDTYPRIYESPMGMKVTVADQANIGEDLWTPSLGGGPFDAVAFVVDCRAGEAIGALQAALARLLAQEALAGLPLLVLAEHAGRSHSMTIPHVASRLGLVSIWDRRWSIQAVGKGAEGIFAGMDWLFDRVSEEEDEPVVAKITRAGPPLLGRTTSASNGVFLKLPVERGVSVDSETTACTERPSDTEADTIPISWVSFGTPGV